MTFKVAIVKRNVAFEDIISLLKVGWDILQIISAVQTLFWIYRKINGCLYPLQVFSQELINYPFIACIVTLLDLVSERAYYAMRRSHPVWCPAYMLPRIFAPSSLKTYGIFSMIRDEVDFISYNVKWYLFSLFPYYKKHVQD